MNEFILAPVILKTFSERRLSLERLRKYFLKISYRHKILRNFNKFTAEIRHKKKSKNRLLPQTFKKSSEFPIDTQNPKYS